MVNGICPLPFLFSVQFMRLQPRVKRIGAKKQIAHYRALLNKTGEFLQITRKSSRRIDLHVFTEVPAKTEWA